MNVVVADTSPINYLVLIDCIELLRQLYSRIVVPVEVFRELTNADAPAQVAALMLSRPDWIEVRSASLNPASPPLADGPALDIGEEAAIRLALTEADPLLLIDEAPGRSLHAWGFRTRERLESWLQARRRGSST